MNNKPTIEELKEHFENAAEIQCLLDTRVYDLSKLEITKDYYFFNNGVWLEVLHKMKSVKIWSKEKGYAKTITYKNNMEITEQQIKDLESGIVKVKELFPDLFKEKIESGFWYKYKGEDKFLTYIKEDYTRYGIGTDGIWFGYGDKIKNDSNYIKATNEEVEEALTLEAIKRGYKDRVQINSLKGNGKVILNTSTVDYTDEDGSELFMGDCCIMKDGIWAEIIPQDEKLYTEKDLVDFGNKVLQDAQKNIYSQIENFKLNR